MRKSLSLAALGLLTLPLLAEPLPAGGKDVTMPGFTIHTPGAPWAIRGPIQTTNKDGSLLETRAPGFAIDLGAPPPVGSIGSVYVQIDAAVMPAVGNTVAEAVAEIRRREDAMLMQPTTRTKMIHGETSITTINGNSCVRVEAASEDYEVPGHHGEPYPLMVHGLLCPHPDFPSYVVSLEYSTRLAPGEALFVPDADGRAVQNSLRFTPLGYRVSQIPLGALPQMLAEGFGAVWAAYGGAEGMLARINPATGAVEARIPVGKLPIGVVSDASGIWVANRDDNTVMQIDPATNRVVRTVEVSSKPQLLAAGAGAIWVAAQYGPVWRIDPQTGTTTRIRGAGGELGGIAVAGGQVYVADYPSEELSRINPATNKVEGHIAAVRFISHLAADGDKLWASVQEARPIGMCWNCRPEDATPVHRYKKTAVLMLDLPSGAQRLYEDHIGNMPRGAALWRGKLWVANWSGASLSVLDPSGPADYFPIGFEPVAVVAAGGSLWVTVGGITNAVLRLEPK